MPDKTPPAYLWSVTLRDAPGRLTVEAAYSDVEPTGHMVLKAASGNPVFTAEPGMGCTFERRGRADAAAAAGFVAMLGGREAETVKAVMNGDLSVNAGRRKLGLSPFEDPAADGSTRLA